MGPSRTPTQNTAGDGFPADPIDGSGRNPSGVLEGRKGAHNVQPDGRPRLPPKRRVGGRRSVGGQGRRCDETRERHSDD